MNRILIIGSPGSGKSTLSLLMAEKLGLPVVHLDKLFWRPGWVEATREEFDALSGWDGEVVFIRNKREYGKFLLTLQG